MNQPYIAEFRAAEPDGRRDSAAEGRQREASEGERTTHEACPGPGGVEQRPRLTER